MEYDDFLQCYTDVAISPHNMGSKCGSHKKEIKKARKKLGNELQQQVDDANKGDDEEEQEEDEDTTDYLGFLRDQVQQFCDPSVLQPLVMKIPEKQRQQGLCCFPKPSS